MRLHGGQRSMRRSLDMDAVVKRTIRLRPILRASA